MKPKSKNHPQGFSLIELLFTMVFLSVIVFGVIKLETSNLALSNTHNLEIQANTLASQALEITETLGEDDVRNAWTACGAAPCNRFLSFAAGNYNLVDVPAEVIDTLFTRTLSIVPIGVAGRAIIEEPAFPAVISAYQVTAQVSWTDSTGEHTVNAKRIIYE